MAKEYPDIEYEEMIVDNCSMQLAMRPEQFDVMVRAPLLRGPDSLRIGVARMQLVQFYHLFPQSRAGHPQFVRNHCHEHSKRFGRGAGHAARSKLWRSRPGDLRVGMERRWSAPAVTVVC